MLYYVGLLKLFLIFLNCIILTSYHITKFLKFIIICFSTNCNMEHCNENTKGTSKSKVHSSTCLEGPDEEQRYSSTIFLNYLFNLGNRWGCVVKAKPRHAPAVLPLEETCYPLYRRLEGSHGRSRWVQKIAPPSGFDSQTVQPAPRSCTDYDIQSHKKKNKITACVNRFLNHRVPIR